MSHTAGLHSGPRPQHFTTVVEDAGALGKLPLDWEPGTKWQYSEGPLVGAAIIEVISGMPYPDFIKQRILDPLGMKDSTFFPDAAQALRTPITGKYNLTDQKLEDLHLNDEVVRDPAKCAPVPPRIISQGTYDTVLRYKNHYARGDSNLYSSALDMSKFCQMLLNNGSYQGRQYLTPASVKEMATIQTGNLFPNKTEGYGIGTFIQKIPSEDGPSPGSFGHRGALKTVMWVDPRDNLVLILMTAKWDLKGEEQKAINTAFFKTAIDKYSEARGPTGGQASADSGSGH